MTHAKRVAVAGLSCKIATVWALAVWNFKNSEIFLKQLFHQPWLCCCTNCKGSVLHTWMGLNFWNIEWYSWFFLLFSISSPHPKQRKVDLFLFLWREWECVKSWWRPTDSVVFPAPTSSVKPCAVCNMETSLNLQYSTDELWSQIHTCLLDLGHLPKYPLFSAGTGIAVSMYPTLKSLEENSKSTCASSSLSSTGSSHNWRSHKLHSTECIK